MTEAIATFTANDRTIGQFRSLANCCGVEGVDWRCEWCDGGRVRFAFKDADDLTRFRNFCIFFEL